MTTIQLKFWHDILQLALPVIAVPFLLLAAGFVAFLLGFTLRVLFEYTKKWFMAGWNLDDEYNNSLGYLKHFKVTMIWIGVIALLGLVICLYLATLFEWFSWASAKISNLV